MTPPNSALLAEVTGMGISYETAETARRILAEADIVLSRPHHTTSSPAPAYRDKYGNRVRATTSSAGIPAAMWPISTAPAAQGHHGGIPAAPRLRVAAPMVRDRHPEHHSVPERSPGTARRARPSPTRWSWSAASCGTTSNFSHP